MRIVLQRVKHAAVTVDGQCVGEIGHGFLALLGIGMGDTTEVADKLADKLSRLRIFEDENGKTNLSAADVGAEILVVSQFTLYADCRHGNRPSFTAAADPQTAEHIYNYFADVCATRFTKTARGVFGAHMQITLENDGPFTVLLDSEQ